MHKPLFALIVVFLPVFLLLGCGLIKHRAIPAEVSWAKSYGGAVGDWAYSTQQTSDGGYIVPGETYSFGASSWDFWVLKLNSDGTISWQKTYGGTRDDYAPSIQQTSDGGYIVAGYNSSFGAGNDDFWVLKLRDSNKTSSWVTKMPI